MFAPRHAPVWPCVSLLAVVNIATVIGECFQLARVGHQLPQDPGRPFHLAPWLHRTPLR